MPETLRLHFDICPACGDETGVPIAAGNSGDETATDLMCPNCENRWNRNKRPDLAVSAQAQSNARMDAVIRLRPKLDRRSTPRF